jgi:hypothetical protein
MNDYYTYIYYDPSRSNEPIYVGKGSGHRAWGHKYRVDRHPFVQRLQYMKKNSIVPLIGLYAGLDEELAYLIEEELIAKFGRRDLGKGSLLNLTDGGDGNRNVSDLTRQKISASNKGKPKSPEHCAALSLARQLAPRPGANKGGIMSDENKQKISATKKGKPWTQARRDAQNKRGQ